MHAEQPGSRSVQQRGWLKSHRYLLLRRLSQISILALFWAGTALGWPLLQGNLSSSSVLGAVPLTDPFVFGQMLMAGHAPELAAVIGAVLVVAGYMVLGGRLFCSWVCPVNIVTDSAAWLRRQLGLVKTSQLSPKLRYWLLAMSLVLPLITGFVVWELVNPVSLLQRGLIFGISGGWTLIGLIFLFDLFITQRGWCRHICPHGALYSLIGKASLVRIEAPHRQRCDDCMDCYKVCPEPQVLKPVLKGETNGVAPVILDSNCTNCGRCIDVCAVDVFKPGTRFATEVEKKR